MNHHVLPPLVIALSSGFVAPRLLGTARWPLYAPRLAATAWAALGAAFIGVTAITLAQIVLPEDGGLLSLLAACRPWGGGGPEAAVALVALGTVAGLPLVAAVRVLHRSWRQRAEHAAALRVVGRRMHGLPATVLEHHAPVAYCLPGRSPQVVVSSGALVVLSRPQLAAVLEHEWAHIAGRHHLPVAAAEAFGRSFGPLPLARRIRTEVPLLMELAADDRTVRRCSSEALATALYTMASGRAPSEALAAGGPSAALRIRRVLGPRRPLRSVVHGLFAVAASAAWGWAVIAACCAFPG